MQMHTHMHVRMHAHTRTYACSVACVHVHMHSLRTCVQHDAQLLGLVRPRASFLLALRQADFTEHKDAGRTTSRSVPKFVPPPEKCWGPKERAKGSPWEAESTRSRKNMPSVPKADTAACHPLSQQALVPGQAASSSPYVAMPYLCVSFDQKAAVDARRAGCATP